MTLRTVPGEEELGVQKLCPRCGAFYPADTEFFYRMGSKLHSWCKACWASYQRGRSTRQGPFRCEGCGLPVWWQPTGTALADTGNVVYTGRFVNESGRVHRCAARAAA